MTNPPSESPIQGPVAGQFGCTYFDGKTSQRHVGYLLPQATGLSLTSETACRQWTSADLEPMQAQVRGRLLLQLVNGGTLDVEQGAPLQAHLRGLGVPVQAESSLTAVLHSDWRIALTALIFLVGVVTALYVWVLPSAAETAAQWVPAAWERKIGQAVWTQMDRGQFHPSRLPQAQQDAIRGRFVTMLNRSGSTGSDGYVLYLRQYEGGPNAFSLPGNIVVLSDELVQLVDGDMDTISGVLGHELGHLQSHHGMRSVFQAAALSLLTSTVVGDYSALLANASAAFGALSYSRAFELEADAYARDLMCNQGINPVPTAKFFDQLQKLDGNVGELIPGYASTHPKSAGRAAFFRHGC